MRGKCTQLNLGQSLSHSLSHMHTFNLKASKCILNTLNWNELYTVYWNVAKSNNEISLQIYTLNQSINKSIITSQYYTLYKRTAKCERCETLIVIFAPTHRTMSSTKLSNAQQLFTVKLCSHTVHKVVVKPPSHIYRLNYKIQYKVTFCCSWGVDKMKDA